MPSATANRSPGASRARPFYGWVVVAAVFIILATTSGFGFYNASVILSASTKELGTTVGPVSGATGLFFAVSGLSGYVFARWMDTVDLRYFFFTGGLIGGGALYSLRWVSTVPGLYVFFAVFGVGFGLAGLVPGTTLVTRWFDRRRPVALSIASTGLSVGGITLTPIAANLIENRGLANAGQLLAVGWTLGIIPIALLAVRSRPSDLGLQPDGTTDPNQPTPGADPTGEETSETVTPAPQTALTGMAFEPARRTRFFLALSVAYAFIYFGQVGAIAQLYNMARERTDLATASTCISVLALSSVGARLIGGVVVLRTSTKLLTAALALVQVLSLVLLAQSFTSAALIASSVVLGTSMGNLLMLQPLLLAEAFGVTNYGRIYSLNQLAGTIGVAGGPLGLGLLRDSFDYRTAFFAAALSSFSGFLALLAAGSVRHVQAQWSASRAPATDTASAAASG